MPRPIHKRLQQQIDHYLAHPDTPDPSLDSLLRAISDTYEEYEQSRGPSETVSQPEEPGTTLQESERRLRSVLQASPDGIVILDMEGHVCMASPTAATLFGLPPEQKLTGVMGFDFIVPEDRERAMANTALMAQKQQHGPIEYRAQRADGTLFDIEINAQAIQNEDSPTRQIVLIIRDITARKQAEAALRESRQITDGIIDALPIRVFWKDKNLKYLGCNKAFAKDAGFLYPEDLVGKDDTQMSWKRQAGAFQKDDRQIIRSKQPKLLFEESMTLPDGKTMDMLSSKIPLRDADEHITGLLGVYLDITERKDVERRYTESNARQRDIAANIPGVVYQLQFKRTGFPVLDYMSTGCEKLFERPLVGMNYAGLWFDHMPKEDLAAFHQTMAQATRYMQRWSMDFRILRPDGTIKWLRGAANPQKNAKGRILWNGVVLDITEQKRAEEEVTKQLEELQRWQRATLGREGRISALKREVNAMAARLGQPRPYDSTEKK